MLQPLVPAQVSTVSLRHCMSLCFPRWSSFHNCLFNKHVSPLKSFNQPQHSWLNLIHLLACFDLKKTLSKLIPHCGIGVSKSSTTSFHTCLSVVSFSRLLQLFLTVLGAMSVLSVTQLPVCVVRESFGSIKSNLPLDQFNQQSTLQAGLNKYKQMIILKVNVKVRLPNFSVTLATFICSVSPHTHGLQLSQLVWTEQLDWKRHYSKQSIRAITGHKIVWLLISCKGNM